jgi:TetR/AcrR family transcriptional repressor of mexJK operon
MNAVKNPGGAILDGVPDLRKLDVKDQQGDTIRRRRPRRTSLSHETFLDIAFELFLENGFERTSIDAIAVAAGIAKRTVYLRYLTKKNLFQAALERAIDEWIVPAERLQAAECMDLEDTLLAIGQILVDNALSPMGLRILRLLNAESGRMPDVGEYSVHKGTDRTLVYLTDLFSRRADHGAASVEDAEQAAEAFLHLLIAGPAYTAGAGIVHDQAAIDKRVRYCVSLFLHGLPPILRPGQSSGVRPDPSVHSSRLEKLLLTTETHLELARERLDQAYKALVNHRTDRPQ